MSATANLPNFDERLIAKLRALSLGALPLPNTCSIAADRLEALRIQLEVIDLAARYAIDYDGPE